MTRRQNFDATSGTDQTISLRSPLGVMPVRQNFDASVKIIWRRPACVQISCHPHHHQPFPQMTLRAFNLRAVASRVGQNCWLRPLRPIPGNLGAKWRHFAGGQPHTYKWNAPIGSCREVTDTVFTLLTRGHFLTSASNWRQNLTLGSLSKQPATWKRRRKRNFWQQVKSYVCVCRALPGCGLFAQTRHWPLVEFWYQPPIMTVRHQMWTPPPHWRWVGMVYCSITNLYSWPKGLEKSSCDFTGTIDVQCENPVAFYIQVWLLQVYSTPRGAILTLHVCV